MKSNGGQENIFEVKIAIQVTRGTMDDIKY